MSALLSLTGVLSHGGIVFGAAADAELFERRIRPALAEHCWECHGSEKQKGGLRLDHRAELLKGGDSGPAVVPGKPDESRLIAAIAHADPKLAMPSKRPKLDDALVADFARWIREGADWPTAEGPVRTGFDLAERKARQPWLWTAPRRQTVPQVKGSQPTSDVDAFVRAKLDEHGIDPAPPADPATWLRRVHFVITGLPPSREALHAFLADPSPTRRSELVDRLLASPEFGECWARHWMDLVRYAETRGHESDFRIANAWQYRDYLVRAFNADVPYDQFLREHLAGDLLAEPRLRPGTDINESVLGTGWAFLGEENHSPVDIRQDECERIDNKLDVFGKTFLGLTVACARCHDHKFDPIRAQDYYALSGFILSSSFRQVRFEAMENNRRMAAELRRLRAEATPRLARLVAADRAPGVQRIADYLLAAKAALRGFDPSAAEASGGRTLAPRRIGLWADHLRQAATNSANPLHRFARLSMDPAGDDPVRIASIEASSRSGGTLSLPAEARVLADFTQPGRQSWKSDGEAFGTGPLRSGELILGADPADSIARVMTYGAARRDAFWNRLRTAPGNENDSGRLAATARSGQTLCTPTVTLSNGKLHYLIRGKAQVYAAVDSHLMVEGPLHGVLTMGFDSGAGEIPRWVSHDLSAYSGHRAHIEFGPDGDSDLEVLMVVESAVDPAPFVMPTFHPAGPVASLAEWAKAFEAAAIRADSLLAEEAIATAPNCATDAVMADWLVRNPDLLTDAPSPATVSAGEKFVAEQKRLAGQVRWESHTSIAWFDGTGVDENILLRGKPFKPGATAPRSLPAAFPDARPITPEGSSGRGELARELTDPVNPLVARVFVNRVWHHVFGRGIVASVDNFGALGDRPTHPELLDHLTWGFVHEDAWSLKRLIRRLVLTDTFAQSSRISDRRAEEADPTDALFHRMPVRRLEGEAIRDAMLAVSGRLDPAAGGPPVEVHLNEFTVGRGRPDKGGPLDGDGRRSIYTALRRNFLPSLMQTFDTPTPFSTVGRRNVTNVPGQSLALMNDPLFHQQAGVWAERMLKETPGADAPDRIRWLFESGYSRPPDKAETAACLATLAELKAPGEPPLEVWGELCHALVNASDFIYLR